MSEQTEILHPEGYQYADAFNSFAAKIIEATPTKTIVDLSVKEVRTKLCAMHPGIHEDIRDQTIQIRPAELQAQPV